MQLPEGPPEAAMPLSLEEVPKRRRPTAPGGAHSKRRQHPPKAIKGGQIRPGVALIRQLEVELGPL